MNNAPITFRSRGKLPPIDGRNFENTEDDYTAEAITSIDGRYKDKVKELFPFFSEYALNKYRIIVELAYLKKLSADGVIPGFSRSQIKSLQQIVDDYNQTEFKKIKSIERKINHDVKAIEYYLRGKFEFLKLGKFNPYIHIALTSYDTNDLAYALMLKESEETVLMPLIEKFLLEFKELAMKTKHVSMLARTHGQPAVPTTFGKEMANYHYRLHKQYLKLKKFKFEGKCNGAVGNFNAHFFTYPKHDWMKFSEEFIASFGLQPNVFTTQLLSHDNWIEYFQILTLVNGILVDASVNFWLYIMLDILVQKKVGNEVGSSTMPQKVNPIDFENAEGNLQVANSHFELYQRKLLHSRLQRDLSDSTVRRTFGSAFGYMIIGWKSCIRGLSKINLNESHIKEELNSHWEILAEAVQTYLRSVGDETAYEKLKALTRGKVITKELYGEILKELKLEKLKQFTELTPETYTGLAEALTESLPTDIL